MVAGPRVSPAMTTRLVVQSVSQATRTLRASQPWRGAWSKNRSTTSSEMRSQTLSGWPSETDSLVKKYKERAKKCLRGLKGMQEPISEASSCAPSSSRAAKLFLYGDFEAVTEIGSGGGLARSRSFRQAKTG